MSLLLLLILSCGKEEGDLLTLNSISSQQNLVLGSQDGNNRGVTIYDIDGNFIRSLDFRAENGLPRGIIAFDENSFLVSLDTTDSIYSVTLDGEKTVFHGSAQFNGTQYDMVKSDEGFVYAIESNRIEVFNSEGIRQANRYITTTVGSCVLNSPRGLHIREDGKLVVAEAGATDRIYVYDISEPTPVCESAVAFPGRNPHGVVEHSDGSLYITTQTDSEVYRADPDGSNPTLIWSTDISIIRTPTDILELPNGNLLVASSVTDTIEQLTTEGVRVGTVPFIRDSHSLNISSMAIVGGSTDE